MIYLDYCASVPLRPSARDALADALEFEGNPSSPHQAGRKLRSLIDSARKKILEEIEGNQLIFTSGGTEANALALSGLGDIPLLVSAVEHDSILKASPSLHSIPVTEEGIVNLKTLEKLLVSFKKPGLLSLMLVNNETGVIQPIQDVVTLAHMKGWKVHTDASQALGHIPLSFEKLGVDMMTLSSHKCGGPIGIGALVLKHNIHLQPLIRGGGQEFGMRSGTLSAPLVLGFAAAFKDAMNDESFLSKRLLSFQQKIEEALPEALIYGKEARRVAHIACLGMPGVPADLQLMALDLKGISVSAGAACSSGKMKESHVLTAMGICSREAQCVIRLSMGWKTQENEIDVFIHAWKDIYSKQKLKEAS